MSSNLQHINIFNIKALKGVISRFYLLFYFLFIDIEQFAMINIRFDIDPHIIQSLNIL